MSRQPEIEPAKPAGCRGRPASATPKVFTAIRLDADVLEALRATGPGWQTRVNELLRGAVALTRLQQPVERNSD